ncbi:murein hydrolase activator EnvC family protein [Promicromonospora sp. Marseille-Q5078]
MTDSTSPPAALPPAPRASARGRAGACTRVLATALAMLLAGMLAVGAGLGGLAPALAADGDAALDPSVQAPADGWQRPVPGDVVHPFDPPAENWLAGHRGVDLASGPGEQVRSPAAGTVSFAGQVAGKPVVVVTHADGLRSTFEPVTAAVGRGDAVGPGDVVGALAGTPGHCAPAGCLHWGVLRGDVYLDPLALLGAAAPIVLLPGGP